MVKINNNDTNNIKQCVVRKISTTAPASDVAYKASDLKWSRFVNFKKLVFTAFMKLFDI